MLLNDEKFKARLDFQMQPETCLKPLGCMDDSPQADVVAEQGQTNRGRTTVGHDDSTTPSCWRTHDLSPEADRRKTSKAYRHKEFAAIK